MEFVVVTSVVGPVQTGNRRTAAQVADLLRGLGHRVAVVDHYGGQAADVLVALHGARSRAAIDRFRRARPGGRVVVLLTGTDIYPEPDPGTFESVRLADLAVAFQPRVPDRLPPDLRGKARVILQSARPPAAPPPPGADAFEVCVVGHLRAIKDPLAAARAARLLPAVSRIRVLHAGAILEPAFADEVEHEARTNPRYTHLGELDAAAARALIGRCRLQVVSSFHEGGGRVIGESLVAGTPVLAARNDATASQLGDDYEGLYEAGRHDRLAGLLHRAETEPVFFARLQEHARTLAPAYAPEREAEAWRALVDELHEEAGRPAPIDR